MEKFVNLINVNCVVFWQMRWLPTKRKLKKGDYLRHAEAEFNSAFRYEYYSLLGVLWFVPMAALVTKLNVNNFWTLSTTLVLSIALSYLFHWYFLSYKNKWRKYMGPKTKRTVNFARKLPEKQRVILNFAGWAGQNKLYQNLYFGLIFDGRGARFL